MHFVNTNHPVFAVEEHSVSSGKMAFQEVVPHVHTLYLLGQERDQSLHDSKAFVTSLLSNRYLSSLFLISLKSKVGSYSNIHVQTHRGNRVND